MSPATRVFVKRNFEQGLAFFALCVKEFANILSIQLPYMIEEGSIEGFSFKRHSNADEKWTRALKLLLVSLKCIQSHFIEQSRQ
jgi:hypothetical protein